QRRGVGPRRPRRRRRRPPRGMGAAAAWARHRQRGVRGGGQPGGGRGRPRTRRARVLGLVVRQRSRWRPAGAGLGGPRRGAGRPLRPAPAGEGAPGLALLPRAPPRRLRRPHPALAGVAPHPPSPPLPRGERGEPWYCQVAGGQIAPVTLLPLSPLWESIGIDTNGLLELRLIEVPGGVQELPQLGGADLVKQGQGL